jgi:hypothetical protein
MGFLRWVVSIHKWIALIVGIQIALWIAGGVVMSIIPIEVVRGEHKIAEQPPAAVNARDVRSLQQIEADLGLSGIRTASISALLGNPVWRLVDTTGARYLIDAKTGERLNPLDEDLARAIALADYTGDGQPVRADLLAEAPDEYPRPAPVWQVAFNDSDNTTLYIDPETAHVTARRSSTWRFYDLFWRLHIMDYDDGADFNHPLLIGAALTATLVALSGLILVYQRTRRSIVLWRKRRTLRTAS